MYSERRVKVASVRQHDVLDWFVYSLSGWPEHLVLPMLVGIPADAKVECVVNNPLARTFDFLISHPSFDEVPEGDVPPGFPDPRQVEYQVVAMPRPEVTDQGAVSPPDDADTPVVVTERKE
jgi:hypothetical protein